MFRLTWAEAMLQITKLLLKRLVIFSFNIHWRAVKHTVIKIEFSSFVPNSNYKVWFFQNFKPLPPLFHQKAKPHRFLSIEVAPKQVFTGAGFKSPAPLSMSITIGLSGLTKLLSETRLASKPWKPSFNFCHQGILYFFRIF